MSLYLGKPYPKYLEYEYKEKPKRFRFVKYDAGFCTGLDEENMKRAELDDWCFQYYGRYPQAAKLKTLYYDVGGPELIGIVYEPQN